MYFIWVARDPRCAQWFNKDLHALKEDDQSNILDIQIFITGVQPPTDVRSKLLFVNLFVHKSNRLTKVYMGGIVDDTKAIF